QNLRSDGVAVLYRGHLARAPHRRERERVARQGALPRRVEVDRAAVRWHKPVVERELERRRWAAETAAEAGAGRRNHHRLDVGEAEGMEYVGCPTEIDRVRDDLADRRVVGDRTRHRAQYLYPRHIRVRGRVEVPDGDGVGERR